MGQTKNGCGCFTSYTQTVVGENFAVVRVSSGAPGYLLCVEEVARDVLAPELSMVEILNGTCSSQGHTQAGKEKATYGLIFLCD